MTKKLEQLKENLLSRKWYSLPLLLVFLSVYWFFGLAAVIFWFVLLFVLICRIKSEPIIYLAGALLILTGLAMILKNYELANILAAYVFYFLIIATVLKINEYRQNPQSFIEPITYKNKREKAKFKLKFKKRLKTVRRVERNKTALTLVNIGIIITYIILFGASLPNQNNYFRFLVLLIIIVLANAIWPILRRLRQKKIVDPQDLLGKVKDREKILIITLNACLVLIYVLISGFNWAIFNIPRLAIFLFIIASVNFFAFADLSND